MNVFHEEDGGLKASIVLAEQGAALQVESPHGKRGKIKATHVLLRFERPSAGELMADAERLAQDVDIDFLWECCPQDIDFGFEQLAKDYFGHTPSTVESVAVALSLHASPMFFYKKGKGRYKPATPDNLRAAKAGLERKKREEMQRVEWVQLLQEGRFPEAWRPSWRAYLYRPDRNLPEVKAIEATASEQGMSVPQLFAACGVLESPLAYHRERFIFEWFGKPNVDMALDFDSSILPKASIEAFSIDDVTTTEIDDAFSVVVKPDGNWRVGIHIALPAIGIEPGSEIDLFARSRMSTVYMPGDKFTMLPDSVVEQFTLAEGRWCPALSLYLTVKEEDYSILHEETLAEQVFIGANLRHGNIEEALNEEKLLADSVEGIPFATELSFLWRLANARAAARGHIERSPPALDYNFYVENDRVEICPRIRGNPIDRIVSEMMIHANQSWGGYLKERNLSGIYRSQINGKTSLGVDALPHQGLGVNQYAWSSSPLRRYVDLINQWQLLRHVQGKDPHWPAEGGELPLVAKSFETAYDSYSEFQRNMERFWSLRWLIQHEVKQTSVVMLKEGSGRISGTPYVVKVHGASELSPGTHVMVDLGEPNLWELTVSCQYRGPA
jgi:exoribonuclease II